MGQRYKFCLSDFSSTTCPQHFAGEGRGERALNSISSNERLINGNQGKRTNWHYSKKKRTAKRTWSSVWNMLSRMPSLPLLWNKLLSNVFLRNFTGGFVQLRNQYVFRCLAATDFEADLFARVSTIMDIDTALESLATSSSGTNRESSVIIFLLNLLMEAVELDEHELEVSLQTTCQL